jgi:ABC-type Mn2+/Zn2+ transport system ATPase subunit/predicted small lipoprotein YifL
LWPEITLLELRAKNIIVFGQNDDEGIRFGEDRNRISTITGPAGSGKTSCFKAIYLILRFWQSNIIEDSILNCPSGQKREVVNAFAKVAIKVKEGSNSLECTLGISHDSKGWHKTHQIIPPRDDDDDSFINEIFKQFSDSVAYVPQDHGLGLLKDTSFCVTNTSLACSSINARDQGALCADMEFCTGVKITNLANRLVPRWDFSQIQNINFAYTALSGGQLDALFTLIGCHGWICNDTSKQPSIILLDEPGQNLGSHQRSLLLTRLMAMLPRKQIIIITHHTEMLDRKSLPYGIMRVNLRGGVRWYSAQTKIEVNTPTKNKKNQPDKQEEITTPAQVKVWQDANCLDLYFADGAIICEGDTDVDILSALDEHLRDLNKQANKNERLTLALKRINAYGFAGFKWKLLAADGNDAALVKEYMCKKLTIPYVIIFDTDTLFEVNAGARASEKVFSLYPNHGGHVALYTSYSKMKLPEGVEIKKLLQEMFRLAKGFTLPKIGKKSPLQFPKQEDVLKAYQAATNSEKVKIFVSNGIIQIGAFTEAVNEYIDSNHKKQANVNILMETIRLGFPKAPEDEILWTVRRLSKVYQKPTFNMQEELQESRHCHLYFVILQNLMDHINSLHNKSHYYWSPVVSDIEGLLIDKDPFGSTEEHDDNFKLLQQKLLTAAGYWREEGTLYFVAQTCADIKQMVKNMNYSKLINRWRQLLPADLNGGVWDSPNASQYCGVKQLLEFLRASNAVYEHCNEPIEDDSEVESKSNH